MDWQIVDRNSWPPDFSQDKYYRITGGFFMIEKALWLKIGGMKTKYKKSEDYDLGLRLSRKGFKLLRKNCRMVTHHTIDYQNTQRMWKRLFNGSLQYPACVLFRDHIFNFHFYPIFIRNNYSMILLFLSIVASVFNIYFIFTYLFIAIARTLLKKKVKGNANIIARIIYRIGNDLFALLGIFTFFPRNHKLQYIKIR